MAGVTGGGHGFKQAGGLFTFQVEVKGVAPAGSGAAVLPAAGTSSINQMAARGQYTSALVSQNVTLPDGTRAVQSRLVEAQTASGLKSIRSRIESIYDKYRHRGLAPTARQTAALERSIAAESAGDYITATEQANSVLTSLLRYSNKLREERGAQSEHAKYARFEGQKTRALRDIAAKRAAGRSGPELDAYEAAVASAVSGVDPTNIATVTAAKNAIASAKGKYETTAKTLTGVEGARERLAADEIRMNKIRRKAEASGLTQAELSKHPIFGGIAGLQANIEHRKLLLAQTDPSVEALSKFGKEFSPAANKIADAFKDLKRPSGWEHSRAGRIGRAMVARAIMGQISGFAGEAIMSEGDALVPNLATGGLKSLTGAGTAHFTNKLITGDPKDAASNLKGLIGFGIADVIASGLQKFIQRGLGVRREATATMHQQEMTFAKSIMPDQSLATAGYMKAMSNLRKGLTAAGTVDPGSLFSLGDTAGSDIAPITANKARAFGSLSHEEIMEGQRVLVGQMRRDAVNKFVRRGSSYAWAGWGPGAGGLPGGGYNWGDTITYDQMYAGMGALGGAGARAGLLAKYYQSKGYNIAGGDMGMFDLGARVAGISANSEVSGQTVAQLMASEYLGLGTGVGGAFGMAKATQMGLPGAVANQIGTSIAQSGLQGLNLNQDKESAYIKSLTASGMSRGRIGMLFNAGLQGRQQARDAIGGGFKGMMGQAALLAALESSGGDLSAAMDAAAGMSSYDQMQAMRKYFGDDISKMTLQQQGLTGADALKAMGAGPDAGSSSLDPILALATQSNITANREYVSKAQYEKSITEENRAQSIKEALDSAAASLTRAAGSIGELIP